MTEKQKAYYFALRNLCKELGRPVTSEEVAGARAVSEKAARAAIERLIISGAVVWCKHQRKRYYWPRGWQPLNWPPPGEKGVCRRDQADPRPDDKNHALLNRAGTGPAAFRRSGPLGGSGPAGQTHQAGPDDPRKRRE